MMASSWRFHHNGSNEENKVENELFNIASIGIAILSLWLNTALSWFAVVTPKKTAFIECGLS